MTKSGRTSARKFVAEAMRVGGLSRAALAQRADVDPKTLRAFLDGTRWPQETTRRSLAKALGWEADEIDRIEATGVLRVRNSVIDRTTREHLAFIEGEIDWPRQELTFRYSEAVKFADYVQRVTPDLKTQVAEFVLHATDLWSSATDRLNREGGEEDADSPAATKEPLSEGSGRPDLLIAAHEEETSISAEQEESDTP